jgi:hypothetical protein
MPAERRRHRRAYRRWIGPRFELQLRLVNERKTRFGH